MTKNKRYSFNWERGHPNFWDNHCDLADCYLTCADVVDRLNELHEENQELKVEYADDCNEANSMTVKISELTEENEQLKEQLEICKDARQAYKQDWKACVSYCDTYKDEIHTLKDNIQGLIEENKVLKNNIEKLSELCIKYDFKVERLEEENEGLKQRNDRQAKQLDRLYSLIEEENWTALSDIIDDFKRCEEQLQKEWGTYDDFK